MARRSAMLALAFAAWCVFVAACVPLPIPHTELKTPVIRGTITRDDGLPAAGRVVAARETGWHASCRAPRARTTTDSLGRFELPQASVREKVFWLPLLPIDKFDLTGFLACEMPGDGAVALPLASSDEMRGSVRGTAVSCLEWSWLDSLRLTCESDREGPAERRIFTGGEWSDSTGRGTYRVILRDEAHCYDGWRSFVAGERVFVQWLADGPGVPHPVRATAELNGDDGRCVPDGAIAFARVANGTVVHLLSRYGHPLDWVVGAPRTANVRAAVRR